MTNTDFVTIDYVNNWNICVAERFNQWMIEHDDGYYIFCKDKTDCYRKARMFTRPSVYDYQEV